MKESVAVAKEADAKKGFLPDKGDKSVHRVRDDPERQLDSLRGVIGNIRSNGGKPSVDSIETHLNSMHTAERAPVLLGLQRTHGNRYVQQVVTGIQAKLAVGPAGDVHEREADRVVDMKAHLRKREESEELSQTQMQEEEEEPEISQNSSETQGVPPHWVQTKRLSSTAIQGQIQWGNSADTDYSESAWGGHTTVRSNLGESSSWGASEVTQSIVAPKPVWGGPTVTGGGELVDEAIIAPVQRPLKFVQNVAGFNANILGATFHPTGFKAPDFKFNTADKGTKKAPKWYAKPTLTTRANEGNSKAFYVGTGLHKTTHTEIVKGKKVPVHWRMPKAMASRNYGAELEHSNDHKYAYKISLKEAESVLTRHIAGRNFGPKPTQAATEQMVLDRIQKKLTHPQLGNDKTQWGAKYRMLSLKTLDRDTKGWHNFSVGNRKEVSTFQVKGKAKVKVVTKIIYVVNKGTTKIGVVPSSKVIKY